MAEKNLSRRIADYLDANGWEGGKVKGKQAGALRRWIDDDHFVTVELNNRHLTPSATFRANSHRIGVGLTHVGIMKLFGELLAEQSPYSGYIKTRLDRFGGPKWIDDADFSSDYGEHLGFDEVIALVDSAHEQLVENHLGPVGIRAGVEQYNNKNLSPFYALTVDAFVEWTSESASQLGGIVGIANYDRFNTNLTEYLGYDPLNPPES